MDRVEITVSTAPQKYEAVFLFIIEKIII